MAWSDAARRAAVLARRMRRVQRFGGGQGGLTMKQIDQQAYLSTKLTRRFMRMRNYARSDAAINGPRSFRQMLHVETGGNTASRRKYFGGGRV